MSKRVTEELIDKKKFEKYVKLGLSDEELQQFFMVNSGQFYQWVKVTYKTKKPLVLIKKMRVQGKIDFLTSQKTLAKKEPAVSIWVGKNYYAQTDKIEIEQQKDYEDLNPLVKLLQGDGSNADSNN